MEVISTNRDPFVIGIISDTHIPDRVKSFRKDVFDKLHQLSPDLILHAGDISILPVIQKLEEIAPVRAVVGNRDFLLKKKIPISQEFQVHGTILALTHGHMDTRTYWKDKLVYLTRGYRFDYYQKRMELAFPEANVVVYGHTHHAENRRVDGKLFFNPGSVSHGDYLSSALSFGILEIFADGKIDSEIIQIADKP